MLVAEIYYHDLGIHRLKLNATGADYGLAPNGYMPPPALVIMRLLELLSTLTRLPLDKMAAIS